MSNEKQLPGRILYLFQKYINNDCTSEELEELFDGLKMPGIEEHLDTVTLALWGAVKKHDIAVWSEEQLEQLKSESVQLVSIAQGRKHKRSTKRKIYSRIAAAAIVLIFLGTGIAFWKSSNIEAPVVNADIKRPSPDTYFETGITDMKILQFPDGSKITMNAGSKLGIIEKEFNGEKREIWLEGEAFFEVAKNPKKPFIIHNDSLQTTVLGTSFNIRAYRQLAKNVVSVRSGKVKVGVGEMTFGILTKNKELSYQPSTGKPKIAEANWEDAAAWIGGRLVFKQAGAKEIKLRLKQQFDIDVEIRDNVLNEKDTYINSSFGKHATLKEVLEVIGLAADAKYDIVSPNKVVFHK